MDVEPLFWKLYRCPVEAAVYSVLEDAGLLDTPENWKPYGGSENNYGVVENQQASPIPALVEKITNGIDAILERRCLEERIDPKSPQAPKSISDGVAQFFPDHKNWDLTAHRKQQSEMLQIVADGPRMETSLVVFDEGIGQSPEDFENTFLSLLRGNKNEIHFVQGKYNMGGAGAVAFCGKHRYQLIASKRFDNNSEFGFTLVRRHPLTASEEITRKNTWYEYLVIDGHIPSFNIDEIDLGLANRRFRTGSVIKLYSYDLPTGSRSVISRDLNQSLNEYLFRPALPILTVDKKERYPDDRNLERDLFGLQRRLEDDDSKYVQTYFSDEINDAEIGTLKVTSYVFNARAEGRSSKDTRSTIQREFFKNNMAVIFSMNGQVHGHLTSEFVTRSLKFPLLKDHLLIHVDCTGIKTSVRNELFMASRDRLKGGEESRALRRRLATLLTSGRLKEINASRKASLNIEGNDAEDLLRNMTRHMPLKQDLAKLLNQTFRLDDTREGKRQKPETKKKTETPKPEKPEFNPQRFPSTFQIEVKAKDQSGLPLVMLPAGSSKIIRFSTDVEDHYFDRVSEPGELRIALLGPEPSGSGSSDEPGRLTDIKSVLNVVKSSPTSGTIRVHVNATDDLAVGDAVTLRAELSQPSGALEQVFMVKVTDPENKKPSNDPGDTPDDRLGLPEPVMVYKEPREDGPANVMTWEKLDESGIDISHETVVHPLADENGLSAVYINMDSTALLNYRGGLKTPEAITVAEKRYFSAVYFHTLFLFAITRNRKYLIQREAEDTESVSVEITEYISDLFTNAYAQFLLSFDTQELISALEA
ncbi:hypothetical protein AB1K42_18125 [Roseibium algicola]|uniref:hypothetical protein n=1 Tax=Roseibium algicola TaxID=2857014 RepID=UPI00345B37F9